MFSKNREDEQARPILNWCRLWNSVVMWCRRLRMRSTMIEIGGYGYELRRTTVL